MLSSPANPALEIGPADQAAEQLKNDAPILATAFTFFSICVGLIWQSGGQLNIGAILFNLRLYLAGVGVVAIWGLIVALARHRPSSPIAFLRHRYFHSKRYLCWIAQMPMLVGLVLFLPAFSKMKTLIPYFNPYDWDAAFILWDQTIFLGNDAWQVLQPFIGFAPVTSFISACYQVWILLLYLGCMYLNFWRIEQAVRRVFFLTYFLVWVLLGVVMATALSSVGPCFLLPIMGDPHFADQMAYLAAVNERYPVYALPVQDLLIQAYKNADDGLGSGITAMPSLHVAIAFLFFLAMRRISRRAGWAFFAFFVIILIGSVHLAYHYAVDGLVSIVATALLWKLSWMFFEAYDRWRKSARLEEAQAG